MGLKCVTGISRLHSDSLGAGGIRDKNIYCEINFAELCLCLTLWGNEFKKTSLVQSTLNSQCNKSHEDVSL